MIRVLHMIGSLEAGGSQSMVMSLYRKINRKEMQFDFVIDNQNDNFYKEEIENMGGKIYFLPKFNGINYLYIKSAWNDFFERHKEYKILHSHVRSYACIYLPIAKKHNIVTIIHSHNTSNGKGLISVYKNLLQFPLRYQADFLFACSEKAGKWLYGKNIIGKKNFYILNNAIEIEKFHFDSKVRDNMRNALGIKDKMVFIHVGRFVKQKNHEFLLDIFYDIQTVIPNSYLLLVGNGNLEENIKSKVNILGLKDKVEFMGVRTDVNKLLMAADIMLFPSINEGLPLIIIEAQAASISCFIADTITREVAISNLVHYIPINKGTGCWINEIEKLDLKREDVTEKIISAGYDISMSSKWLENFYRTAIKSRENFK